MKPANWDKMTNEEKVQLAIDIASSMRGRLLISQALYHAIKVMSEVPLPMREVSNIQDMEIMLDGAFPIYKAIAAVDAQKSTDPTVAPV